MTLFEELSDRPLTVESSDRSRHERDTTSGFVRASTVFSLHGDGATGRGEDVTYDVDDHDALDEASSFDLAGEYTVASFSAHLDDVDLFPTKAPERETAHHYRRWALESAGLDLALRQAETDLASALGRDRKPVRFVVSTRLSVGDEDPSLDRIEALRAFDPGLEFKLDPTSDWTDDLVAELAALDAVRILDLKGQYHGTGVDQKPDPALYERVLDGFPEAVVEDPALTESTTTLFDDHRGRVSWDAPITGVESVEALPFEPRWLNVKPSRFGTVESLFSTLDYCFERDIQLYGGGQFELDVGRAHIQTLASTFYPTGPNDVAPGGYNDPELELPLPSSPLQPSTDATGLSF